MLYRLIAPNWLKDQGARHVLEGEFSDEEIHSYNAQGYNIYYFPNHPKDYDRNTIVTGSHIDVYNCVFIDCDLKDGVYKSKDEFIEAIGVSGIEPSRVIDSGNGVHAYWNVTNLDAKSYLRLSRR